MDLLERVRQVAARGGDLSAVRAGLDQALRTSVVYDMAAISTVDPATLLWTSCWVSGLSADGEAEREQVLYALEFAGDDLNSYTELASSGRLVGRLHQASGGDVRRAKRRPARVLSPARLAPRCGRLSPAAQCTCSGSCPPTAISRSAQFLPPAPSGRPAA